MEDKLKDKLLAIAEPEKIKEVLDTFLSVYMESDVITIDSPNDRWISLQLVNELKLAVSA